MRSHCKINQFIPLSGPHPTFLVTSKDPETENKAIITVAWTTPLSVKPPLFGIVISPRKATHVIIKKAKAFTVNIPTLDLLKETWWVGTHTGRNYEDKIAKAGLSSTSGKVNSNAVSILEAIASFECKVVDEIAMGDHTMFVGEVVSVEASEEFFNSEKSMWIPESVKLIYHVSNNVFTTNKDKALSASW